MSQLIETLNPIRTKLTYPPGTIKMMTVQIVQCQKLDVTFARGNEDEDPEPETKEEVELVVFTAYTADDEAIDEEDIAYLAQTEAAGFVAWNKAFAKGKSKGKGKGKGKFKRTFRYSHYSNGGRPPNRKTLEERKEALKKLKAKTKCKTCGAVGHWAGDQECPKKTRFGGLALSLPTTDVPMQPDVPPEDDQSIQEERTDMSVR